MKVNEMHNLLVDHYRQARSQKTKKSINIESIVGQTYKKKAKQIQQSSPLEDFLRNQQHIAAEPQPLYFRTLPRRLKVYFPGPPVAPPQLQQTPYTYQIVPNVPFKMPKQKPGYVGDWVLEQSGFVQRKSIITKKNKSVIENYRSTERNQNKNKVIINNRDRRALFKSQIRNLAKKMRQKSLTLKQIIKNKGIIKKPHNFYNSTDFFLMCRAGDKQIAELLERNSQLAFDIDEQQMTGLHWAARGGHTAIVRLLTQKYKANCHAKDCYGRTPLHLAVENKNVECIIRIFIEGGKLNAVTKDKKTVRMVANDAYIKYLIDKLEQINFIVKAKNIKDLQERKNQLQTTIRSTLDQSSLYF